ncbi:MAG: hypothetical protein IK004_08250 [Bacteroidales bacterium]|nr:hypothetical protein [Bacteroidales bacterium]
MRNFAIIKDSQNSVIDQYRNYLNYAVNHPLLDREDAVYDYNFMQQLGVLQADEIQKVIRTNGAILYEGIKYTNANIQNASSAISSKMDSVAKGLTSSLEKGFTQMEVGLGKANQQLSNINENISGLGNSVSRGFTAIKQEQIRTQEILEIFRKQVGKCFDLVFEKLEISNMYLSNIYAEMRIPEFQRERRYFMEQGIKYLRIATKENDRLYYEDAVDAFRKSIDISPDDYFSWFYLGYIYLNSTHFLDIIKAKDAFERYIHYVRPEIESSKQPRLIQQLDSVYLYMAEISYLKGELDDAVEWTNRCAVTNEKVIFLKAKYLSASRDNSHKCYMAAQLLKEVIVKNPFLSLQVLEDADLISNDSVITMLNLLKNEAVSRAKSMVNAIKAKCMEYDGFSQAFTEILKIEKDLHSETYLEACEAINNLNKRSNWVIKSFQLSFISSMVEYCNNYISCLNNFVKTNNNFAIGKCVELLKTYDKALITFNDSETFRCREKLLGCYENLKASRIRKYTEQYNYIQSRVNTLKDYATVLTSMLSILEPLNKYIPYSESTDYKNYNTEDCDLETITFGVSTLLRDQCISAFENSKTRLSIVKLEINALVEKPQYFQNILQLLKSCTYLNCKLSLFHDGRDDTVIENKVDDFNVIETLTKKYLEYVKAISQIPSSVPKFPGFLSPFQHARWIAACNRAKSNNRDLISTAKAVNKKMHLLYMDLVRRNLLLTHYMHIPWYGLDDWY